MSRLSPLKVVNLDLADGAPPLSRQPDSQGLYLIFWWRGLPLGHREIPNAYLPMPPSQVADLALDAVCPAIGCRLLPNVFPTRPPGLLGTSAQGGPDDVESVVALDRPLSRLAHVTPPEDVPFSRSVSVIVCTRDRPQQLEQCLGALRRLSPAPAEILVVDNAPRSDATRRLVAGTPGIRYLQEPRPGLSRARNTGIRATAGEIIAFTDDDAIPHPGWIAALSRGFAERGVAAVTGLVLPAELDTDAQVIFERAFGGLGKGYRPMVFDSEFVEQTRARAVPVWRIGAGANMALRRTAIAAVRGFDERLGAGAAGCSEDSELWYRLLANGWTCRYEPAAVVFHVHRRTLPDLGSQMRDYMRGHVAALLVQFARYGDWGNLRRIALDLPRQYARRLRRGLAGRSDLQQGTLWSELRGCAAGVTFFIGCTLRGDASAPEIGPGP